MDTISVPNKKGPGLYEFLIEAELQHYFNGLTKSLKITHPSQLKFTTDNDLAELGMSKPEVRRLKKYYEKHFPNNYLLKFKKLLMTRKHDAYVHEPNCPTNDNLPIAKAPRVPSKHIIPASNITVNKELGMGEFGVVQQGVWSNEGERIQVAVKCLAKERMQTNTIEFLKEAAIMHSIDHPHIVRMFGVVLDTGSLMLVTELAPLRSLLECLKEPALRSSFPTLTLCDFAVQICEGMQYLEAKRLIHRDLAARNILVFSKNKVKISDFGLSRALGQGKDYYQTNFNVNLKLPIAWCAPECISYLRFTTASDVWAFGVTLWEMFSYGFQPWPALTGQQILEAIDEPNYQRLEQPDCCPQEHYALMLDCWRHEASTRPRFADIYSRLIDSRPEQVQAKTASGDGPHMLFFRIGDIITVLDKISHRPLWKGVSAAGKTGLFDPTGVVAYLGSDLPSSSFLRSDSTRTSARRKLRSEMISAPQGDLKHTGHVGLDGAYFGDLSFLGGTKSDYGGIPTQVVAPYRPHKDLESAPLLEGDHVPLPPAPSNDHEYHEISDDDDENASHSPNLDLGPSLMAEMEMMFNSLGQSPPSPADHHEGSNKSNELRERLSKPRKQATVKPISSHDQKTLDTALAMANEMTARSMSAPAPTTPVSPNKRKFSFRFPPVVVGHDHDKQPVERRNFAEEVHSTPDLQQRLRCSLSSLTDDYSTNSIRLPLWDKASAEFYFAKSRELLTKPFPKTRTPLSSHHPPQSAMHQRNSCRDLPQQLIDDDYSVENRFNDMSIRRDVYYQTHSYLTKSENLTRKTYNNNINNNGASNNRYERNSRSCLYDAPPPPSPFNRNNGESFTFSNYDRRAYERELEYEPVYSRGNPFIDAPADDNNGAVRQAATVSAAATTTASDTKSVNDVDASLRPRALSFSETPEIVPTISMKKPTKSRSIRDRNRRRQSYNPRAYVESSSSETDCASLGSVDLDWRRRKRLGRLSTSNSSIRSELLNVGGRCRVVGGAANGGAFNYLKPDYNNGGKALGRSPPPSNSVLSGLSPTTVSRCQRPNDSSTSDSSL